MSTNVCCKGEEGIVLCRPARAPSLLRRQRKMLIQKKKSEVATDKPTLALFAVLVKIKKGHACRLGLASRNSLARGVNKPGAMTVESIRKD